MLNIIRRDHDLRDPQADRVQQDHHREEPGDQIAGAGQQADDRVDPERASACPGPGRRCRAAPPTFRQRAIHESHPIACSSPGSIDSKHLTSVVGFSVPIASLRVWPGSPYPLGATWDGVGVNFALFSEHATRVELCLFDSRRRRSRVADDPAARTDRHGLARLSAGRAARASSMATACTVRSRRTPATASIPTSCVLDPYARVARPADALERSALRLHLRRGRHDARRPRDSAPYAPLAAVVDNAFTWGDDRPPRTPWHETLIYELHVKGFTQAQSGDPRGAARHLSRPRVGAGDPASQVARGHGGGADAGPSARRRLAPRAARPRQLLGLQHARPTSPRTSRYAAAAVAARRRPRVQDDGAGAARRRPRGHPRRGLQPHRRRQSHSARRCRCAASTTRPTTACCRTSRASTRTSPAAATR